MSEQEQNFYAILASTIHDIKNSLGMVINDLEEFGEDDGTGHCHCTPERAAQLQYEAKRVNDNLIQLLTLYRAENAGYSATVAEVAVAEFLEEIYLLNAPMLEYKGLALELVCEPDLYWYLDRDLVAGVLNNLIHNATRYTRDRIRLSAEEIEGELRLCVEDDGEGYPEEMLSGAMSAGISFGGGHTGLGLHFCRLVAHMHENRGREGHIALDNGGEWGGGRFCIFLP